MRIVTFLEATFAKNQDIRIQLGRLIMLSDDTNRVTFLSFKSNKSKSIMRSVLASEQVAISDLFVKEYAIRHELETLYITLSN